MSVISSPISSPISSVVIGPEIVKFGNLPGSIGDFFSTPDSVAASITGDLALIIDLAATTYSLVSDQTLLSKWTTAGNQRSYLWRLKSNGALLFNLSVNGIASLDATSSVSVPFSDGERGFLAVTWNQSSKDVTFFTSTDGVSFTQLGTTQSINVASIFDGASIVEVGTIGGGVVPLEGKVFGAQIISGGLTGTVNVDCNPNDYVSGSTWVSSSTGETWTINGNASIQEE